MEINDVVFSRSSLPNGITKGEQYKLLRKGYNKDCFFIINDDGEEMEYNKGYFYADVINEPKHYHVNGIDVIKFAELQFSKEENKGFFRTNVIKYTVRYDRKNGLEDLKKAQFYLNKLIELEGE